MQKISWIDSTTKEVLERVLESRSLLKSIKKRQYEWIDHFLRYVGLLGLILRWIVDGKNPRGRPQLKYMSYIIED